MPGNAVSAPKSPVAARSSGSEPRVTRAAARQLEVDPRTERKGKRDVPEAVLPPVVPAAKRQKEGGPFLFGCLPFSISNSTWLSCTLGPSQLEQLGICISQNAKNHLLLSLEQYPWTRKLHVLRTRWFCMACHEGICTVLSANDDVVQWSHITCVGILLAFRKVWL
jgi:hypothetical protein